MKVLCMYGVIWGCNQPEPLQGFLRKLHKALLCAVKRAKTCAVGLRAMAYNGIGCWCGFRCTHLKREHLIPFAVHLKWHQHLVRCCLLRVNANLTGYNTRSHSVQ